MVFDILIRGINKIKRNFKTENSFLIFKPTKKQIDNIEKRILSDMKKDTLDVAENISIEEFKEKWQARYVGYGGRVGSAGGGGAAGFVEMFITSDRKSSDIRNKNLDIIQIDISNKRKLRFNARP